MKVKKAFWIFAILTILDQIDDRIIFVILPFFLLAEEFSASQIGIIFSVASVILLMSRIFIGKLSDVWGRKKILSSGLLIKSASISLFPFLGSIHEFGIVKGLREIGDTLGESVHDALQADVFKKKTRAKILAKLGTILPLSRALAAIIGFLIVTYLSLYHGFFIAAGIAFLSFLVFTIFFKEEKPKKVKRSFKFSMRAYSKKFKLIAIIGFLIAVNFSVAYFPGFFILAQNIGISEGLLFILLFLDYIISSLFAWWSGKWIDKFGREKTVALGAFLFSFFILLYPFSSSVVQFFLILVIVSIGFYIYRIAFKTILMDATIFKYRGEQMGFAKTLQGIGDMIGPALGGFLIDSISLASAFYFAGFIGLIAVFLAWNIK
ncbi:MAG: MFS transporter [Candidatus Aenigmarchaeota archaeon]|nr:MFS transporter [Candidatus Aenigmarchaeota archaeon]